MNRARMITNMNNIERACITGFLKAADAMPSPTGAPNMPQGQQMPGAPQPGSNAGGAGAVPQGVPQMQGAQGISPMQQPAPGGGGSMPAFMQLMQQYMQQTGGAQRAPAPVQPMHIHQPQQ